MFKKPGTHASDMILANMILWLWSFQAFYSDSEEEMNLEFECCSGL